MFCSVGFRLFSEESGEIPRSVDRLFIPENSEFCKLIFPTRGVPSSTDKFEITCESESFTVGLLTLDCDKQLLLTDEMELFCKILLLL